MQPGFATQNINSMYRRVIAILAFVTTCLAPVQASEKDQCLEFYEAISAEHTKSLRSLEHDTPAFYSRMHDLEDELFYALEQCPKHPLLFSLMAENQISLNNLQLANLYASKAQYKRPDIWQTNHALGTVLVMQQKYQRGLLLLERAFELAPQKRALHFNLCSSYVVAKEYEKALTTCTQLIELNDQELTEAAYFQRSLANRALGKIEQADKDLAKAQSFK